MRALRILLAIILLVGFSSAAFASTAYEDLAKNDLASFSKKVELLDLDLTAQPYLSYYLSHMSSFDQSMLDYLAAHKADPNAPDADGISPIHWAILKGDVALVKAVMDAGASTQTNGPLRSILDDGMSESRLSCGLADRSLSVRGDTKISCFSLAILLHKPDIVDLFLPAIDDMSTEGVTQDDDAISALELCFWNTNSDTIDGAGAIVLRKLWNKEQALPEEKRAAIGDPYKVALFYTIIDDLANMKKAIASHMENSIPYIPYAILASSSRCLDFLLKLNDLTWSSAIDVDMDLYYGSLRSGNHNPLYAYALADGNGDMVKVFADNKADFNRPFTVSYKQKELTEPALDFAMDRLGSTDIPRLLISAGADVRYLDSNGLSPIHHAIQAGNTDVCQLLLKAGAGVNTRTNDQETPVEIAAGDGNLNIVKMLAEAGADLSLVDKWGYGPIHMAVWSGSLDVLTYLVGKNAPYGAKTKSTGTITVDGKSVDLAANMTPLDIATTMRDAAEKDSTRSICQAMVDYLKKLPPWKKK